jgi:thiol:disulfide interchange protein DsbD
MPLETVIGLPMAFSLGLMYGLGPCLVSCLPYLGPIFLARDFGIRRSWRVVAPLSLGRLVGYGSFGFVAGLAGQSITDPTAAPTLRLLVGCAAVMIGTALLWRRPSCAAVPGGTAPLQRLDAAPEPRPLLPGGVFLMGLSMAMTPCAPLGVVLLSAATTANASHGLLLGLAFGLGAIVVPSLVFGLGAAYLGARLREQLGSWRPHIERLAAALLLLTGFSHLWKAL